MGGIGSCLKACLLKDSSMEGLFFVSCDLPFFRKEMAVRLTAAFKEGDDGIMWRTRDGRLPSRLRFLCQKRPSGD